MKSKVVTIDQAMEKIHDGQTLMVPGFVNCGVPQTLIAAILKAGYKDFNIISNNTSVAGKGIGKLIRANAIKHITCSHIGNNTETVAKVVAGEINVTFVPQGTLCERMRAGGAGIGGVLTPTGIGTPMQDGKQVVEWDKEKGEYKFVKDSDPVNGNRFILELPLHADVALIHAYKADKIGNVIYHRTARNFNPIMATAADFVIVEAEEIVEVCELDPDQIVTPSCLVDMIVQANAEDRK
jgi:acetate CoA/acetoacetate CoA-transferase alpha subunit